MRGIYYKGRINTINQDEHTCTVSLENGLISPDLNIVWYLRRESGNLQKNDEVVFVLFDDNTGIVTDRMDGDWEYKTIKAMEVHGDFTVKKNTNTEDETLGNVLVSDGQAEIKKDVISHQDVKTDSITLNTHVHSYLKPLHSDGNTDTTVGK